MPGPETLSQAGRSLVIGSAGFIGSHLTRQLVARDGAANVATLDKEPHPESGDHVRCDITSPDLHSCPHARRSFDVVFNLAAVHRDDVRPVSLYDEVNVEGARQVCRLADAVGARRLVFTSSVAVYGFAPPNTDETGAIAPFNDYGRTKALAEEVYRAWAAAEADRTLIIVRLTVVFGPGNRGNVHLLLSQIAAGRFAMIGSGRNVKSMAYVDNVAAFLTHAGRLQGGVRVYNYVDKPDLDMRSLAAEARRALGRSPEGYLRIPKTVGLAMGLAADVVAALLRRPLPFRRIRVEKFCATTQFAAATLAETGFRPPLTLTEGLDRTLSAEFPGRSR